MKRNYLGLWFNQINNVYKQVHPFPINFTPRTIYSSIPQPRPPDQFGEKQDLPIRFPKIAGEISRAKIKLGSLPIRRLLNGTALSLRPNDGLPCKNKICLPALWTPSQWTSSGVRDPGNRAVPPVRWRRGELLCIHKLRFPHDGRESIWGRTKSGPVGGANVALNRSVFISDPDLFSEFWSI